jgi:hypothetical protein
VVELAVPELTVRRQITSGGLPAVRDDARGVARVSPDSLRTPVAWDADGPGHVD